MLFFSANKLVSWLNHFFQCKALIKAHYQPWSYVAKTGKYIHSTRNDWIFEIIYNFSIYSI